MRRECTRCTCQSDANSARMCCRLVEAENVRLASGDLSEFDVVSCDVPLMRTGRARLPLLSCDHAKAQEHEHYSYSQCDDRFGREFHHLFCSGALRRNSFHPPPELNEVML